ncbi:MAG: 2-dehydropantoate 2-reductase N-terminal domain-containing protein [Oscillospiraceae bacterium]
MKIAMIGSGAAGSVFASYLKKGGAEEVWLVDPNKAHMDKVAKDGMIFRNPDGVHVGFGPRIRPRGRRGRYSHHRSRPRTNGLALGRHVPSAHEITLQNGLGNESQAHPRKARHVGCGNMGTGLPNPAPASGPPPAQNVLAPASRTTHRQVGKYLEVRRRRLRPTSTTT